MSLHQEPGGRLNKKDGLTRYGDCVLTAVLSLTWKSPYVDKTVFILRRGPGHQQEYCSGLASTFHDLHGRFVY